MTVTGPEGAAWLRKGAEAAGEWLLRSITATQGYGSAAVFSVVPAPRLGWGYAYPETTGYIIPTLIKYSGYVSRPEVLEIARQQADWLLSVELLSGGWPGGYLRPGSTSKSSVFNTGQVIQGLAKAGETFQDHRYVEAAHRGAAWLAGELEPKTGKWLTGAYVADYSPAYYTRVAWPMLQVQQILPDAAVHAAAVKALDAIAAMRLPSGTIRDWGFRPDKPAFTHTIAYTLRGFYESGRLLEREDFCSIAEKGAERLLRSAEIGGGLAGTYEEDWKPNRRFKCLTGSAQAAGLWVRIWEDTGDPRYLSAACKELRRVRNTQRTGALWPSGVRGGIAGSRPIWGPYLPMRFPNWAAKFFADAAMATDGWLTELYVERT